MVYFPALVRWHIKSNIWVSNHFSRNFFNYSVLVYKTCVILYNLEIPTQYIKTKYWSLIINRENADPELELLASSTHGASDFIREPTFARFLQTFSTLPVAKSYSMVHIHIISKIYPIAYKQIIGRSPLRNATKTQPTVQSNSSWTNLFRAARRARWLFSSVRKPVGSFHQFN